MYYLSIWIVFHFYPYNASDNNKDQKEVPRILGRLSVSITENMKSSRSSIGFHFFSVWLQGYHTLSSACLSKLLTTTSGFLIAHMNVFILSVTALSIILITTIQIAHWPTHVNPKPPDHHTPPTDTLMHKPFWSKKIQKTNLDKHGDAKHLPLFILRRFSSSLGFNSSGAEHEHLKIPNWCIKHPLIVLFAEVFLLQQTQNWPVLIPNVVLTSPLRREKKISWQPSPFRATITLSPLLLATGWSTLSGQRLIYNQIA